MAERPENLKLTSSDDLIARRQDLSPEHPLNSVKHLRFSPEVGQKSGQERSMAPLRPKPIGKQQDMNKRIAAVWVRLSQEGDYRHLRETLDQFGLQGEKMAEFFEKEGAFILRCGLIHWNNPKSLDFICQYVPSELFIKIFRSNNFSILENFLLAHSSLEKQGLLNEEMLLQRNEKLNLLYQVDPEGLNAYMSSNAFEHKCTEGVRQSLKEILQNAKKFQL